MHEFYEVYATVYVEDSKVFTGFYKNVIMNTIPKDEIKRYYAKDADAPARFNFKIGEKINLFWDEKKNILVSSRYIKLAKMDNAHLTVHFTYLPKRNVSINDVLNHGDVINAMAYLIERYEGLKESFDKRRG